MEENLVIDLGDTKLYYFPENDKASSQFSGRNFRAKVGDKFMRVKNFSLSIDVRGVATVNLEYIPETR